MHPEELNIRSLIKKIEDPEFKHFSSAIIQRQKDNPSCTFIQAMCGIKEDVTRGHPVGDCDNGNLRQVEETNVKKHQNSKFQKRNDCGGKNCPPSAKTITLKSCNKVEHHHSFRFDHDNCKLLSQDQTRTLNEERRAARPDEKKKSFCCHKSDEIESQIVQSGLSQIEDGAGSIEL